MKAWIKRNVENWHFVIAFVVTDAVLQVIIVIVIFLKNR